MDYLNGINQSTGTPPSPVGGPALTAPASAPQEPAGSAAPDPQSITPEQLAQVPPVAAVLGGKAPGFWVDEHDSAVVEPLVASIPKLGQLGLAAYRSQAKQVVIYNPKSLAPDALRKLDKSNEIPTVVPALRELAVAAKPDAQAPAPPAASPAAQAPAPGTPAPSLAPRAEARITGARLQALMPGQPTDGAAPGQGRILNGLLKRSV